MIFPKNVLKYFHSSIFLNQEFYFFDGTAGQLVGLLLHDMQNNSIFETSYLKGLWYRDFADIL